MIIIAKRAKRCFAFCQSHGFFMRVLFAAGNYINLPKGVLNMPDIFNAPLDMRAYFESLPKSVQSAIVHSDVSADNLQQLKRLAAGYAGGIYAAEEK